MCTAAASAGRGRPAGTGVVAAGSTLTALAAAGEAVFRQACVACHGEDGKGGHGGGAPLDQVTDLALVMATVTDGRGSMPPLGGVLTAEQIRAVADYVINELFKWRNTMIIDCHGHYTTTPKELGDYRDQQKADLKKNPQHQAAEGRAEDQRRPIARERREARS